MYRRIQHKLRWMLGALGACFAAAVILVALTTQRLSTDLAEMLRLHEAQSQARALDDALDHARVDADELALGDVGLAADRYRATVARAESVFAKLVTAAETSPPLLTSITTLRSDLIALERTLDQQVSATTPAGRALSASELEMRARATRETIAVIDSTLHALVITNAQAERGADTTLWLSVLALALTGTAIAMVAYRSMRRDLALQGAAALAVAESESRFATVLALAADAIITVDRDGRIVNFNRSAETMFRCRAARVVGLLASDLLPGLPAQMAMLRAPASGERPDSWPPLIEQIELEARRASGETFIVEAAVSTMPSRGDGLTSVVLRDVTEHRRRERREHVLAEAATRLSASLSYEEQLDAVANLAAPAVGDWCALDVLEDGEDGHSRIHRVTSTPEEPALEGALWEYEAHTPSWAATDPVLEVLRSGKPMFVPLVSPEWIDEHYADGMSRDMLRALGVGSLMVIPLMLGGKVGGALTIGTRAGRTATDEEFELAQLVAERGAAAIDGARLYRKAQRSAAARDAVLSVVSHDFIGTLGTIAMSARRVLENDGDSVRAGLCHNILTATALMNRLMLDLVDISAIETNRLTVTPASRSLVPVIRQVEELYAPRAEASGIHLQITCDDDLPDGRFDETRIAQVMSNLLDNAIKYTPAGGEVEVSVQADSRELLVAVRDTGPGVSPDDLPHVFEQFWRARSIRLTRGLGLGLAIVRGVIAGHGGRVWMESTLGRGSTVFFTLPRAATLPARVR